ncbi:elongation factor P [Myxococcota bacterium]|nr:elongation factor P [Myxococcota bacterium]MBU1380181.1 elongation factor P [Myxococcota bacterium]MBU1497331.1 elongation factor P [Myxococcota bacterium]
MASMSDLKKNLKILVDGEPYTVVEANFVKPGKGTAFTKCRIKNLITGAVLERTWRSSEGVDLASTEVRRMQYLYPDGSHLVFMDNQTYEQIYLEADVVGDAVKFLTDNLECEILFFNEKPVGCEIPTFVELQITECEPGVRGDTAQGASKPATLSTGAIVNVPLFVNEGEWLKIDTRTGQYVERVKK